MTNAQSLTSADPRWAAVAARDPGEDGHFVYAVRTTGVYCRPSCPSRTARPEHVVFFSGPEAAEQAGFRPCKRCRPDQPPLKEQHTATIAGLCRFIEQADHAPSLSELAERAGLSAYHLHRIFKNATGLTPKAYVRANRARRLRTELTRSPSVTDAVYEAGYSSSGRFYEEADAMLGMAPSRYRSGGKGMNICFATGACSLGAILVAQSERGICAILLGDDPAQLIRQLQDTFPEAACTSSDTEFADLVRSVVRFVEAPGIGLNLPLDIRGTAFQQRVWQALRSIPTGATVSYAELAARIQAPRAARAVAKACAANVLAVAIPCHRVIRGDGELSGYRWGTERKRTLLEREKQNAAEPAA